MRKTTLFKLCVLVTLLALASCSTQENENQDPILQEEVQPPYIDSFGDWMLEDNLPPSQSGKADDRDYTELFFEDRFNKDHANVDWDDIYSIFDAFKEDFVRYDGSTYYPNTKVADQTGDINIVDNLAADTGAYGLAYYLCIPNVLIKIDKNWWDNKSRYNNNTQKIALIYHELGHDVLNLGHVDCYQKENELMTGGGEYAGCWPRSYTQIYKGKYILFTNIDQNAHCNGSIANSGIEGLPLTTVEGAAGFMGVFAANTYLVEQGSWRGWTRTSYKNDELNNNSRSPFYTTQVWTKPGQTSFSIAYKNNRELQRFYASPGDRGEGSILIDAVARAYGDKLGL